MRESTTRATYDDLGNLLASMQVNLHGDRKVATTRYEWPPSWDLAHRLRELYPRAHGRHATAGTSLH